MHLVENIKKILNYVLKYFVVFQNNRMHENNEIMF